MRKKKKQRKKHRSMDRIEKLETNQYLIYNKDDTVVQWWENRLFISDSGSTDTLMEKTSS